MAQQDPITTLTEILDAPENEAGEYEIEINGEIIQLDINSLKIIKKELQNAIFTKKIEKAVKQALK